MRQNSPISDAPISATKRDRNSRLNWRYVVVDQGLVAIIVNFLINWAIAWGVFRTMSVVPLRGELSIVGDTIATCWMLPLIACIVVTALTRREVRSGRLPGFPSWKQTSPLGRTLTQNVILRAVLCAVLGRFLIAPVAVSGLVSSGLEELPLQKFLWFKSLFACGLGIFFCPFYAWWALHDPGESTQRNSRPV